MLPEDLIKRNLAQEFSFSATRSSGPGGQNVNKVNTKVELRFSVVHTLNLSESEKEIVIRKLRKRINKEGELLIVSQQGRTQNENKLLAIEKFYEIVSRALTLPAKRKATRPSESSRAKRLDKKKIRSKVKKQRHPDIDTDSF